MEISLKGQLESPVRISKHYNCLRMYLQLLE